MGHILATDENFDSPLIRPRELKKVGFVVFGSDDGLCGAYNINILKGFIEHLNVVRKEVGHEIEIDVYPVGIKIEKAIRRLHDPKLNIVVPEGVDSKMAGEKVTEFTQSLRSAFINAELDRVDVVYMRYVSMSKQLLTSETLFPISEQTLIGESSDSDENQLYIFEPDANSIFNEVLPMFVLSTMQEITIENRSSEQAARVMAMQSANDNAKKLLDQLQLEYNKLRQQSITTELLDIVGGQVQR